MSQTIDAIKPGSMVTVKVTHEPTHQAARKTLARVLCKDADAKREHRRITKVRHSHYNPQPRGGRMYGGQMIKVSPVSLTVGSKGDVLATLDVIRDLASVQKYVEVSPA